MINPRIIRRILENPSFQAARRLPIVSKCHGFTLIELMVAIAVLAMMMAFVFTLLSRTIATWETGNRRLEASIAARVGLNIVAQELEMGLSGVQVIDALPPTLLQTNIFPIAAYKSATRLPGVNTPKEVAVPGSDQIFFIFPTGYSYINPSGLPYAESGFMCAFVNDPTGHNNKGPGYYLVKHRKGPDDAYLRGNTNSATTNWFSFNSDSADLRIPIIDNCLRFKLTPMQTNSAGTMSPMTTWNSFNTLPPEIVGFLAEVVTIDSRTAAKLAQIQGGRLLATSDIDSITNSSNPTSELQRMLREGSVVMQRYIPLRNKK